jgi:hypothetical protein
MADQVIPFPEECRRSAYCLQDSRISRVEVRVDYSREQGDRIEGKIDFLRNWALTGLLSVNVGLIALLVTLLRK